MDDVIFRLLTPTPKDLVKEQLLGEFIGVTMCYFGIFTKAPRTSKAFRWAFKHPRRLCELSTPHARVMRASQARNTEAVGCEEKPGGVGSLVGNFIDGWFSKISKGFCCLLFKTRNPQPRPHFTKLTKTKWETAGTSETSVETPSRKPLEIH